MKSKGGQHSQTGRGPISLSMVKASNPSREGNQEQRKQLRKITGKHFLINFVHFSSIIKWDIFREDHFNPHFKDEEIE